MPALYFVHILTASLGLISYQSARGRVPAHRLLRRAKKEMGGSTATWR
jgi:hypothetical protein